MTVCWLLGHDPITGPASTDDPAGSLVCRRCRRPLWFWRGQRTGYFPTPEPLSNAYRGPNYPRLIAELVALAVIAFAIWYLWA